MGLIRNAIEQGRQAIEYIGKKIRKLGKSQGQAVDVVIIGAGPAGFAASLGALQLKLRYVTLEQEEFGGTIAHYPRGKIVMTQKALLPLIGPINFGKTTKEALLNYFHKVLKKTQLKINYKERMESIEQKDGGFLVTSSKASYFTRSVLLCIGRRGTPRKMEVPGEGMSKVVYRLIDPEQYKNQKVLVVGGGNSALEAATSIAAEPGTTVTLSYRSEAFSRAKNASERQTECSVKIGSERGKAQQCYAGA
jgi:thioredoxin reductase